jgi:uncharacterized protein YkwD
MSAAVDTRAGRLRALAPRRLLCSLVPLVACVLLVACGRGQGTRLAQPSASFAVHGQAAATYRSEASDELALRGAYADMVGRGIAQAAAEKQLALAPDGRLAQLAEWVADGLDANGSPPPYPVIELWARHLGLPEPTPHLVVLIQSESGTLEQRTARELAPVLAQQRYTHYGATAHERDGNIVAVTVLSWRWLTLRPVPRIVSPGDTIVLTGRIADDLDEPQIVLTEPSGAIRRLEPQRGREFNAEVAAPHGELRIELLARSKLGTTVVANFPVYAGTSPPTEVSVALPSTGPPLDDADVIERLLELVNTDRVRAGLAPLALDDELAPIALAHSQDMNANGFVGHTSPTTGSAKDRVERAGIRTPVVLENIGRGYSPDEVHRGLMDSPGHRGNVLSADATHIGIGVVRESEDDRSAYLVTEVFVRRALPIDVGDAPDELLDLINAERVRRGARPLVADSTMAAHAGDTARAFFAGSSQSRQQLVEALNRKAAAKPSARYSRLAALLTVVGALSEARAIDALLDPQARAVGFGVAQGTRPDTIPNAIVLVALVAY